MEAWPPTMRRSAEVTRDLEFKDLLSKEGASLGVGIKLF